MATDLEDIRRLLQRRVDVILRDVQRYEDDRFSREFGDNVISRLQSVFRWVSSLATIVPNIENTLQCIRRTIVLVADRMREGMGEDDANLQGETTGARGRPRLTVTKEQLEYFIENEFHIPQVAEMLKISVSTVKRRMREFGVSVRDRYTVIDDPTLSSAIQDIQHSNPNSGYRMVNAILKLQRIVVPIHRVRQLCFLNDPAATMRRWMMTVERRVYSVPGPNSLWHIDGNHKLIR